MTMLLMIMMLMMKMMLYGADDYFCLCAIGPAPDSGRPVRRPHQRSAVRALTRLCSASIRTATEALYGRTMPLPALRSRAACSESPSLVMGFFWMTPNLVVVNASDEVLEGFCLNLVMGFFWLTPNLEELLHVGPELDEHAVVADVLLVLRGGSSWWSPA